MLLADNFMHADLHPGNILLRYTEAGVRAPSNTPRLPLPSLPGQWLIKQCTYIVPVSSPFDEIARQATYCRVRTSTFIYIT